MIENREELHKELSSLDERRKIINNKIEALEFEERYAEIKQYEGKYFKEINQHFKENVVCAFIYSIDKESLTSYFLEVNYWTNSKNHFNIDDKSNFRFKKWDDENQDAWIEITKEEYMRHYEYVQKSISEAINKKINHL